MNPPELTSAEAIQQLAASFQRSRILLSAFELDVFTALGRAHRTSEKVAAIIGVDARALDRLLHALCALGLIEKHHDGFANTAVSAQFLVRGEPDFMAGLGHTSHLWDSWSRLTEVVRRGQAPSRADACERGEQWVRPFLAAMHWRARRTAEAIIARLDLRGVSRVLDLGGGSGAYTMALVSAIPGGTGVVFDLPDVVPLTREYLEREGFAERIKVAAGDYLSDPLPAGFDLVLLSAVVHINSPEENAELMRKAAGVLRPAGQVVVQDWVMSEDRTEPVGGALFAINMLVGTRSGNTYTESEIRSWMRNAGLVDIVRRETSLGPSLMIGRDPRPDLRAAAH